MNFGDANIQTIAKSYSKVAPKSLSFHVFILLQKTNFFAVMGFEFRA
jgi:hypothetical protein